VFILSDPLSGKPDLVITAEQIRAGATMRQEAGDASHR
jgi:hypothetical protein